MKGHPGWDESRFSNISAWSIRNPVATLVLFLLLTVAGLAAFPGLRINNQPDIDLPAVIVTVAQPGAAPSELENQVARKVEDAMAGLGDVRQIVSTLVEGASTTVVTFQIGKNIDRATNDIRDKIAQIRSDLPADIREPTVTRIEAAGGAISTYAVESGALSTERVSRFVDDTVSRALLGVRGVAGVRRVGGEDREIRVRLDPDRLVALGITAGDVSAQLRDLNLNSPGGRGTLGGGEQALRTVGSATTVEALRERRIALPGGRAARLADLAEVEDAVGEIRTAAFLDGRPLVGFEIMRTRGSGEVAVAAAAERALEAVRAAHPEVTIQRIATTTAFVEAGYHSALEALAIGVVLAVMVLAVFLRDARATAIAAVAMPLSLVPTFFLLWWLDYSLNNVTLLALTLVVGVLVDDAIVEIENIVRHARDGRGLTPRQAAFEASDEIGLAVLATTATILAVFVPVSFMPGIPGQFFKQFALTVVASVTFSLIVARMLTPLMGAYLLKAPGAGHEEREGVVTRGYLATLGWCLRHRIVTVLGGVLFFAASVAVVPHLPTDLIQTPDKSRTTLSIELPPGTPLWETGEVAARAAAVLHARPEVASVFASLGTQVAGSSSAPVGASTSTGEPRMATLTVNLVPRGQRALGQSAFEREIRPLLEAIPGARFRFGVPGESGSRLVVNLVGDDPETLTRTGRDLERAMQAIPGLIGVRSTASLARPELQVVPIGDRAAELGVSTAAIATTARIATVGDLDQALAKFTLLDRQIPIRVMLREDARADADSIAALRVRGTSGVAVPLSSLAEIRLGDGPAQIERLDRTRKVSVEAELGGMPLGEAERLVAALPLMRDLPPGVRQRSTGDQEVMGELFLGFGIALGSGILLVYLVLVVLFGSFLQPVTIMTALPLSLGGSVLAMLVSGKPIGISVTIGILMLMGIVAKNSILLVEYALLSRGRGMERTQALMEAGRKRARPIVMTTIAMVAGMVHIALGIGADSEFRAPMALVVIGGLITSTVLSLVFVPAAFTLVDDLEQGILRMFGRGSGPGADAADSREHGRS